MGKMVQIRNMPDDMHRIVKARAAAAGMTLSDYLLAELKKSAERPTDEELRERAKRLPAIKVRPSPAQVVREARDRR
ncbi:MAG TPA: hypothetical protein VJZ00_09670 [Thermoanaerobaculia bacterium]|nr:hypothetical protein [Thermoanaerobaculia bacterium]